MITCKLCGIKLALDWEMVEHIDEHYVQGDITPEGEGFEGRVFKDNLPDFLDKMYEKYTTESENVCPKCGRLEDPDILEDLRMCLLCDHIQSDATPYPNPTGICKSCGEKCEYEHHEICDACAAEARSEIMAEMRGWEYPEGDYGVPADWNPPACGGSGDVNKQECCPSCGGFISEVISGGFSWAECDNCGWESEYEPYPKPNPEGGLAFQAGTTPADVDALELATGIEVELEHTSDAIKARQIALDHLTELPDYYTRLTKMEAEAKK